MATTARNALATVRVKLAAFLKSSPSRNWGWNGFEQLAHDLFGAEASRPEFSSRHEPVGQHHDRDRLHVVWSREVSTIEDRFRLGCVLQVQAGSR